MKQSLRNTRPIAGTARIYFLAVVLLYGCGNADSEQVWLAGKVGDVQRGRMAMQQYACHSCHSIPGVVGADKVTGPPLAGIASRMYIAGALQNTPENMLRWIEHPQQVDPLTAMPDMAVKERDALDIAAYLYTLK